MLELGITEVSCVLQEDLGWKGGTLEPGKTGKFLPVKSRLEL